MMTLLSRECYSRCAQKQVASFLSVLYTLSVLDWLSEQNTGGSLSP